MGIADGIHEVLQFWFGPAGANEAVRDYWFRKDPAFDERLRERFGTLHGCAERGELRQWRDTPAGLLALIVVLDQFSRNMYRDSARAFASDGEALECARLMVARGWDRERSGVERWFVYLPFEHSENLADQDRCLELMAQLQGASAAANVVEWARRHRDVIARFGRFPHRNLALGRASTPEEIEFLAQPGSSF